MILGGSFWIVWDSGFLSSLENGGWNPELAINEVYFAINYSFILGFSKLEKMVFHSHRIRDRNITHFECRVRFGYTTCTTGLPKRKIW